MFTQSFHMSQKYLQIDGKRNISIAALDINRHVKNTRKNKTNMTS